MAARSINSTDERLQGVHSVASVRALARRHPLRYRLAVVGPSTADVVQFAGGWLYDRMMAGWDVSVHVRDLGDVRPLQILGATPLELEESLISPGSHDVVPQAIAVAASMFESDQRVREGMLEALDSADAEIRLWGDRLPSELGRKCAPTQHRLSVAARAFKSRAIAMIEGASPIEAFESFCGAAHAKFPSTADLVSAV